MQTTHTQMTLTCCHQLIYKSNPSLVAVTRLAPRVLLRHLLLGAHELVWHAPTMDGPLTLVTLRHTVALAPREVIATPENIKK